MIKKTVLATAAVLTRGIATVPEAGHGLTGITLRSRSDLATNTDGKKTFDRQTSGHHELI